MAAAVGDKIIRKFHEVQKDYQQRVCGDRDLCPLQICGQNLLELWPQSDMVIKGVPCADGCSVMVCLKSPTSQSSLLKT